MQALQYVKTVEPPASIGDVPLGLLPALGFAGNPLPAFGLTAYTRVGGVTYELTASLGDRSMLGVGDEGAGKVWPRHGHRCGPLVDERCTQSKVPVAGIDISSSTDPQRMAMMDSSWATQSALGDGAAFYPPTD